MVIYFLVCTTRCENKHITLASVRHSLHTFFVSFRSPSLFYLLTAGVEVVYFHLITLRHAPQSVGLLWTTDRPVAETSTWQHKHSQETNIHLPVGFEPTIPASARPETYALDRAATGIGPYNLSQGNPMLGPRCVPSVHYSKTPYQNYYAMNIKYEVPLYAVDRRGVRHEEAKRKLPFKIDSGPSLNKHKFDVFLDWTPT
jgi:hypothetical protein